MAILLAAHGELRTVKVKGRNRWTCFEFSMCICIRILMITYDIYIYIYTSYILSLKMSSDG